MPYLRWTASPAKNISNGRAGTPRRMPRPGALLLLGQRHVRAVPFGGLLETNAEFVLLQDPQPLQLGGDQLQGVQLACPACVFVHLPLLSVRGRGRPWRNPGPLNCSLTLPQPGGTPPRSPGSPQRRRNPAPRPRPKRPASPRACIRASPA